MCRGDPDWPDHIDLPALRQDGRSLLFQQHMHRDGRPVRPGRHQQLLMQALWRHQPALLHQRHGLQGCRHGVRQRFVYVQDVRRGRGAVLRQQHVQGFQHDLQEFDLYGVWHRGGPLLRWQLLFQRLLREPLRINHRPDLRCLQQGL
jgi:hypothetical protein